MCVRSITADSVFPVFCFLFPSLTYSPSILLPVHSSPIRLMQLPSSSRPSMCFGAAVRHGAREIVITILMLLCSAITCMYPPPHMSCILLLRWHACCCVEHQRAIPLTHIKIPSHSSQCKTFPSCLSFFPSLLFPSRFQRIRLAVKANGYDPTTISILLSHSKIQWKCHAKCGLQ